MFLSLGDIFAYITTDPSECENDWLQILLPVSP